MKKILLVDDDPNLLKALERHFRPHRLEWELSTAGDGKQAIDLVQKDSFDLVITDILMPEKEGLETIIELRREHPEIKIIAMSGGSRKMNLDVLEIARSFGADHVIEKPFEASDLFDAIRALFNETGAG